MHFDDRLAWRKSSFSGDGENCVEVAPAAEAVLVRHSKRHADGVIAFDLPAWERFLQDALAGRIPAEPNGDVVVTSRHTGVALRYDSDEWDAFLAGIRNREFGIDVLQPA